MRDTRANFLLNLKLQLNLSHLLERERERMNREPTLLEILCVIIAEEWVIDRVGVTSNKEMRAIENLQRPLKKLAPFLKMISRKTS